MTRTIQQLFDLEGKTALVTGGSRGLGLQRLPQRIGVFGQVGLLDRAFDGAVDALYRRGADVEDHAIGVDGIDAIEAGWRIGLEMPGNHSVNGQDDGAIGLFGFVHDAAGGIGQVLFAERLAHAITLSE